jgi:coproporphyrinogen III oxidase-like Fe-S oxidoreductase
MDEINKNTDESWKEAVEKEKEALKKEGKFLPPEPDFNFFITTLSLQTAISLGQIPNPATNQKEEDLTQAKFLIDTLGMLKEKTKGNLKEEETNLLENVLYELRMQYVSKIQGGKSD